MRRRAKVSIGSRPVERGERVVLPQEVGRQTRGR